MPHLRERRDARRSLGQPPRSRKQVARPPSEDEADSACAGRASVSDGLEPSRVLAPRLRHAAPNRPPLALVRLAPLAQDFEGFRIPYDDFVLFDADVQAGIDELFVTDPGLVPLPLLPFPLGGLEVTVRSARCPPASSRRRACSRACRSGASTPALRSVTRTNKTTTPHAFGKLPVVQSALPVAVSTDPLIAVTSDYAPWGLSQPTVAVTDLTSP